MGEKRVRLSTAGCPWRGNGGRHGNPLSSRPREPLDLRADSIDAKREDRCATPRSFSAIVPPDPATGASLLPVSSRRNLFPPLFLTNSLRASSTVKRTGRCNGSKLRSFPVLRMTHALLLATLLSSLLSSTILWTRMEQRITVSTTPANESEEILGNCAVLDGSQNSIIQRLRGHRCIDFNYLIGPLRSVLLRPRLRFHSFFHHSEF